MSLSGDVESGQKGGGVQGEEKRRKRCVCVYEVMGWEDVSPYPLPPSAS